MSKHRLTGLATALALLVGACGTGEQQNEAADVIAESDVSQDVGLQSAPADGDTMAGDTIENDHEDIEEAEDPTGEVDETDERTTAVAITGEKGRLASTVLAGAFEQVTQSSARFEASFDIVSSDPATGGDIAISFSGAYDTVEQSSYFEMDLSAMAGALGEEMPPGFDSFFDEPIKMITIGDEGWLQWGLFEMFGLGADQWLEMKPDDASSLFAGAGMGEAGIANPGDLLGQFADANAIVEDLGRETVRGVETQHHRAHVDLAELAETLSADEQDELAQSLGGVEGIPTVPIDFWIGDDGLLYRFSINLDTTQLPDSNGLQSVVISFEMYDYGTDIGVTAPDPALVVTAESLGLA